MNATKRGLSEKAKALRTRDLLGRLHRVEDFLADGRFSDPEDIAHYTGYAEKLRKQLATRSI